MSPKSPLWSNMQTVCHQWSYLTQCEKACVAFTSTSDLTDFQKVTRAFLLRCFHWFSQHCYRFFLATGFGVIYSSAIWWKISNEIVWESLNIKKKIPKEEGKTGGEWKLWERLRLLHPETDDGEVIEKFDIRRSKEQDGETCGVLWKSSLRVLYK